MVPIKPTKYDEAVKSVQQWNEALKAPGDGTVRVDSRGASASPVPPPRPEVKLQTSASALLTPFKKRFSNLSEPTHTDVFATPDVLDDNWDDDFATSISPSALHLPHLRPVDNFAGMLSADKLKAYASAQTEVPDENWDDQFAGKQAEVFDPNETVRPPSPIKNGANRPRRMFTRTTSQSKAQFAQAPQSALALPSRPLQMKRTSSAFKESGVEDYSDLVVEEDVALDQRFHQVMQVCNQRYRDFGKHILISGRPNRMRLSLPNSHMFQTFEGHRPLLDVGEIQEACDHKGDLLLRKKTKTEQSARAILQ